MTQLKQQAHTTGSFFFYDYETFGIHPARDRISQFGGIRTDLDLNIIDAPIMAYCQQSIDYLPHPDAVLLTGITPQICQEKGLLEPDFADLIHRQFSVPNTCILGYNNIRFDDEMTRYLFFRNFFDPYAHTWKNDNSRWDLIDLVRACYALRPDGIKWPKDEAGLPIFKLEALTIENGIAHEAAHDAMSDVYATIKMAQLIKAKQPRLFDYFFQNRKAKALMPMIDLKNLTPLVHVSGMFGAARSNCSVIAPICYDPNNKNALICVDLMGDMQPLMSLNALALQQKLYTASTDLAENEARIPLKTVHLNKCPILASLKTLSQKSDGLKINLERCLENHRMILSHHHTIMQKIVTMLGMAKTYLPSEAEAKLYEGFLSPKDTVNIAKLRQLSPDLLGNHGLFFQDHRLDDLIFLYRAKHYPEGLSQEEKTRWLRICQTRLASQMVDFKETMTARQDRYQNDPEKLHQLQQLSDYASSLERIHF